MHINDYYCFSFYILSLVTLNLNLLCYRLDTATEEGFRYAEQHDMKI